MAFANPTGACPGRIDGSAFKLGNFQSALLRSIHPALTREKHQKYEQERDAPSPREREPEREASVWDALDGIGREQTSPHDQTITSDAMQRIQERTTEQQNEREREAAEVELAKFEQEKMAREIDERLGVGFHL